MRGRLRLALYRPLQNGNCAMAAFWLFFLPMLCSRQQIVPHQESIEMTSNQKTMETSSKFLSLVLRHKPEEIGLSLDHEGWAEVDDLIRLANASGRSFDRTMIEAIVASSDKKRFALSSDGQRIRANQGHSIEVALGLPASVPPDILYHGTATRFLESIFADGLHAGARQHVHLSANPEVARQVGSRHGKPVVLLVDTKKMAAEGRVFYIADNGVWLTESVPASYLSELTERS